MSYKDKEKQKEANRLASQRRRDKAKGMTSYPDKSHTLVTPSGETSYSGVIPSDNSVIPCQACMDKDRIIIELKSELEAIKKVRIVTADNAKSVAKSLAPSYQRTNHHPMCKCYQCKLGKDKSNSM